MGWIRGSRSLFAVYITRVSQPDSQPDQGERLQRGKEVDRHCRSRIKS